MRRSLSALILFLVCGCQQPPDGNCNPLGEGDGEDCVLPFPSSFYLRPDPETRTGFRVNLPDSVLPDLGGEQSLFLQDLDQRDGFSPATPLLAYFPPPGFLGAPIDGSSLPGPERIDRSVLRDSPVQLLRFEDGQRVPLFAELDANADPAQGERQVLIIRPVVRLRPASRYVALVQGLRRTDGSAVAPLSGFAAMRDARGPMEEIFSFLQAHGVARDGLQLAWDFTTASDEPITGRMLSMRDAARDYAGQVPPPSAVTVHQVRELPAGDPLFRQITGTFSVPSFLTDDETGKLNRDPGAEPTIRGWGQFPLAIHVPRCALSATAPLPVMIFGHGTFSTAAQEMSTPYQREITNRLCMVQVGTDWLGRAQADLPFTLQSYLSDPDAFFYQTERLQQAHVNVITLARLIKSGGLSRLPALQYQGRPLIDGRHLYYYGISEGGIQGATALALTADIERGALNVPCGFWSMFFWRSSDSYHIAPLFAVAHPDPLQRQLLVALTQPLWDYTDPATYAAHLLADPLPGGTPKKILYQEGISDASVPNQDTRAMVRTMGLPLLNTPVEPVPFVPQVGGPVDSAYVQFDVGQRPRLGGNDVPPPVNPVHEAIRNLEAAKQQLGLFLREGGQVQDTCQGRPCVFPLPSE